MENDHNRSGGVDSERRVGREWFKNGSRPEVARGRAQIKEEGG